MTDGYRVRYDSLGVQWNSRDGRRWYRWIQTPLGPYMQIGTPEWQA